jgi:hypothetical protein
VHERTRLQRDDVRVDAPQLLDDAWQLVAALDVPLQEAYAARAPHAHKRERSWSLTQHART